MARFILYSTSGCHLCEEAMGVTDAVLGTAVTEVDIVADERLFALYGTRIPVLRCLETGTEIGWPFSISEVRALLK